MNFANFPHCFHLGLGRPELDGYCPLCFERFILAPLEIERESLRLRIQIVTDVLRRAREQLSKHKPFEHKMYCWRSSCPFTADTYEEIAAHVESAHPTLSKARIEFDNEEIRAKREQDARKAKQRHAEELLDAL